MLASGRFAVLLNTIRRRSRSRHCPLVHRASGAVTSVTLSGALSLAAGIGKRELECRAALCVRLRPQSAAV